MQPGVVYKAIAVFNPPIDSRLSACDLTLVDGKPTLVLLWHEKKDRSARIPTVMFTVDPAKLKQLNRPAIGGASYVVEGVQQLSPEVIALLRTQ